jgi:ubiquinone/menaquinone biosynthesis C-methylase UbiE
MDEQTINTYNEIAKEYDKETVDFWNLFPRSFLNEFIKLSGKRIVDIGSGPGRDGLLLQQAGKDIVCVDASESMVKLSSNRGLKSIVADFNALPFEDNSFDGAWSYTALLHVSKKSIATSLKEINRVLTPDGVFALGLIEGEVEQYKETPGHGMLRLFSYYEKAEVELFCKEHGFELVYFEMFKPRLNNYLNFIFKKTQ